MTPTPTRPHRSPARSRCARPSRRSRSQRWRARRDRSGLHASVATASSGLVVTFTITTPSVCTSGGADGRRRSHSRVRARAPSKRTNRATPSSPAADHHVPELHGLQGRPDDHVCDPGQPVARAVARPADCHCIVGVDGDFHIPNCPHGVHGARYQRHARRGRDVHGPGRQSGNGTYNAAPRSTGLHGDRRAKADQTITAGTPRHPDRRHAHRGSRPRRRA